jgi:hypothetical protein
LHFLIRSLCLTTDASIITIGICQFGIAHVDTPKGDLDASSGALSGPGTIVIPNNDMYPYGTTEQYPAVTDIDGNVLTNTAHEYRECSNKGICDRSAGTCTCFEGYEGAACQRASCPSSAGGVCSGHGTCQTISEIANNDFGNIYKLWDESISMGCVCDGGYSGADCSQRECKVGVDPYYKDSNATVRYTNMTYEFYLSSSSNSIYGNYSLVFYDSFGEDWQTTPITIGSECAQVTAALEALPNNVIAANSVRCYKHEVSSVASISMYIKNKYTIAFPLNPGKLQQMDINIMLDGTRPTLYSDESTSTLGWHMFSDGYIGEDIDFVPDRCFDVLATLTDDGSNLGFKLDSLTTTEIKLLKKCLGDSNGVTSDNVDVYNWDTGYAFSKDKVLTNPHLVKLQDATQYQIHYRTDLNGIADFDPVLQQMPKSLLCDNSVGNSARFGTYNGYGFCSNHDAPGFFAILYFDGTDFRIMANPTLSTYYDSSTPFYIYTTTGHLQLVDAYSTFYTADSTWTSAQQAKNYYTNTLHSANTSYAFTGGYFGDISCENNAAGSHMSLDCVNKDDYVMVFGGNFTAATLSSNPVYHNIYQVKKIGFVNRPEVVDFATTPSTRQELVLDYALNTQFIAGSASSTPAYIYKFYPPSDGGYKFAQPCSGRGICNQDNGLCECFPGYATDDCSCQNCGLSI